MNGNMGCPMSMGINPITNTTTIKRCSTTKCEWWIVEYNECVMVMLGRVAGYVISRIGKSGTEEDRESGVYDVRFDGSQE